MDIIVRRENKNDHTYVEAMTRCAFWNVYKPGCDEHVIVAKLRKSQDFIPELDLVAEQDGKIIGSIFCSKVKVNNAVDKVIAIGPICVMPQWQNKGCGGRLIAEVKNIAAKLNYKGIILYGNPEYYHKFGFVNAKNYGLTTPEGDNHEYFMAFELEKDSLSGIQGKCYESDAFNIGKDELMEFERSYLGHFDKVYDNTELDYSQIKSEFKNAKSEFPLKESECTGLTSDGKNEINPCGTYCGDCEDYGVVCDGCRNRNGRPLWYDMFHKEETCGFYECCEQKKIHDCSQCQQYPCHTCFKFPDPMMGDDFKQMWFKLRTDNLNKVNPCMQLEIEDTFAKNEKKFN